jgi:hypothetical protein
MSIFTPAPKAETESLNQMSTKQLAAVTDELVLVKQQLAQLVQTISATNSTAVARERSPTVRHDSRTSNSSQQQQHEHRRQRYCVSDDQISVLARDEVLDAVFGFVGIGDYYYVAGVCRNWRGRYMTLCHNTPKKWTSTILPPYTSRSSIVATADRLQLALDNGLTIDKLSKCDWQMARAIATFSLEPIAVLTLARCYGLEWNEGLSFYAAPAGKLELMQWMHKCGCPIEPDLVIDAAVRGSRLDVLTWVYKQFASSFTAELKREQLWRAGWLHKLPIVKWLREHGADWPEAFCHTEQSTH